MTQMRLQKFLSMAGLCSRRHGEKYIKDGYVRVNGRVVNKLGTKVDPKSDRVEVQGRVVEVKHKMVYIALNKPKGYIASCNRVSERLCNHSYDKIVLDLVDVSERIYPVGRLDKDSTGLLLLTNNGDLHHRLLHPSFDHEKEYEVAVAKPIPDGALRNMANGLPLMGTKTRLAKIKRISARLFRIVLKEGKNRQIRRMVRKVGNQVVRLKRIRVANILLENLEEGDWRYLTETEKKELLKTSFF